MNNYEYIIASLPVISADFRGELDYEGIVEEIRTQLSKKDAALLDRLLEGFDASRLDEDFYRRALDSSNAFVRGYFAFDLAVRNCKVEYLNSQLGRPMGQDELHLSEEEEEFEQENMVKEILAGTDILQRERSLDLLMWDRIDSLLGLQVFTIDVILAFVAKLQIVSRWLKLDPQQGAALFKQLVNEIRNNKKSIE